MNNSNNNIIGFQGLLCTSGWRTRWLAGRGSGCFCRTEWPRSWRMPRPARPCRRRGCGSWRTRSSWWWCRWRWGLWSPAGRTSSCLVWGSTWRSGCQVRACASGARVARTSGTWVAPSVWRGKQIWIRDGTERELRGGRGKKFEYEQIKKWKIESTVNLDQWWMWGYI